MRWPISSAAPELPSSNETASGSAGSTSKCCWPWRAVGLPHSAAISMSAPAVDIAPPSRITAAVIVTARSVRPQLANNGSRRVKRNCSPRAICTWSSPSLAAWPHWCCRTRRSSMICCSVPVRKPFSRWHATRDISAQRSAFSVCYTRGVSSFAFIHMSTASFPPVVSRRSHPLDSLPREILPPQGSAGGSLSRQIRRRSQTGLPGWSAQLPGRPEASGATQDLRCLVAATPPAGLGGLLKTSLRWSRICLAISGPLYPSRGHLQPSPSLFQGWPGYFPLARFGAPQRTEVADSIRPMNSCAASCCTSSPKGFVRIRNFGFLANRRRATTLPLCFQLLGAAHQPHRPFRQTTHPLYGAAPSAVDP